MSWTAVTPASSMVSEVGYDDESESLIVTWRKSGRKSAYSGVPEGTAIELSKAPSVGTMLNDEIKPFFPHQYI